MLSLIEVKQIRELPKNNMSMRRIASLIRFSRNTVHKYLNGAEPVVQRRTQHTQWLQNNLDQLRELLFESGGNFAVVRRALEKKGTWVGLRQLQRFTQSFRKEHKVVKQYCRRYETGPAITCRSTSARSLSFLEA